MRSLLLWCAQNPWLSTHVPRWGFARRAVRRFLPGEDFASALHVAIVFKGQGIGALFTRLGENVKDLAEATAVVEHYESVLSSSNAAGVSAEISVKPTQVGLDIDATATYANLERLARAADKTKSFLWLDMEGSAYTDPTIDLYMRLRADHPRTGICLQAYLFRTPKDIVKLQPLKPAIRLVKGAYSEPPDRAYPSKRDVDASYLALCTLMLPEVKRGRLRMVLGTHDVELVARVARFGEALEVERSKIEVNMLYGIRADQQVRLAAEGFVVKDLIAYGDAWYAWYLRRLAERPANMLFVARQLLP
ncbi:MAG: proline dehydrogenase family protein [Candidatus Dormiibacterota bacterium]